MIRIFMPSLASQQQIKPHARIAHLYLSIQRPTAFKREKKKQEVAITFTTHKEGVFPVDPTVPAGLPHARMGMGMASCMVSGTLISTYTKHKIFLMHVFCPYLWS
jgi:hypothetical protein